MDLLTEMDMKMSKGNFPYFFENILGYDMADFHTEWLNLVHTTQRTVIICSRDHGKSVLSRMGSIPINIPRTALSNAIHFLKPKTDNGSHERYRPHVYKYSSIKTLQA